MNALKAFDVKIEANKNTQTVIVHGSKGKLKKPKKPVFLGNSGTSARFIMAISALIKGKTIIKGNARLFKRPFDGLINTLKQQGVKITKQKTPETCFVIESPGFIPGGNITASGKQSSQFISALCMISPFSQHDTLIHISNKPASQNYIELTLDVMKKFGICFEKEYEGKVLRGIRIKNNQQYKARKFVVEGDYSSSSYFFAANALGSNISIQGLNKKSIQADAYMSQIKKPTDVPNEIDMLDMPDIVPTLAIIAAFKKGTTTITNIAHLRAKESDRISAVACELNKIGIKVSTNNESITIVGGKPMGTMIDTHNDHRIAMSFAIAGLNAKGKTIINNAQVVNKSYPNFWSDLKTLGAHIRCVFEANTHRMCIENRNIVLIGMRGSGKSTIGKLLAKRLNLDLIEMDSLISKKANMTISKIVEKFGWKKFRKLESIVCKDISKLKNVVISTGGGTILDHNNIEFLKKNGVLIYLKTPISILIKRIKNDPNRPSLTGIKDVEKDLKDTFKQRKTLYKTTADCVIETDGKFNHILKSANICCILGKPVSHSLSPAIHNIGYKTCNLNMSFFALEVNNIQKGIDAIRALEIKGCAVTIPYKQSVIRYLDEIDETAQKIGAVNTILNKNGKLFGTNTDWKGAILALKEKTTIKNKTVAVLGAGGAARAIIYGLKQECAGKIAILNRSKEKAQGLAFDFGINIIGDLNNRNLISQADIIINCTPCGMHLHDDAPIDLNALHKNQVVFDIVFNPKNTKLLRQAQKQSCKIVYGYKMLLYQAVDQFKLFTGKDAPFDIMEQAVIKSLES